MGLNNPSGSHSSAPSQAKNLFNAQATPLSLSSKNPNIHEKMKPSVLSKNHSYLSSGQSNNTDYCNNGVEKFSRKLKNTQSPTTASPLSQS